jgi:hypothetical protein
MAAMPLASGSAASAPSSCASLRPNVCWVGLLLHLVSAGGLPGGVSSLLRGAGVGASLGQTQGRVAGRPRPLLQSCYSSGT